MIKNEKSILDEVILFGGSGSDDSSNCASHCIAGTDAGHKKSNLEECDEYI